jgi:hypothetical protein
MHISYFCLGSKHRVATKIMIKRWIKVNDYNKTAVRVEICSNLYYNNRMDLKYAAARKYSTDTSCVGAGKE